MLQKCMAFLYYDAGEKKKLTGRKKATMKESSGRVFSIALDNAPVKGCTVSKTVSTENGYYISVFSLANGTDISAESYSYHKMLLMADGEMAVTDHTGEREQLGKGDLYITPKDVPTGAATKNGCVYLEITLKEDSKMNEILQAGQVFALKELIPYQEGKIVNMDLVNEKNLKFVLMSFTAQTALSEHAAPAQALLFALDGEAVIGYEGKEYVLHAGENFKFEKGGKHYVKAAQNFKMALLLTFE